MSRTDPALRVRVPVAMKDWLEQEAARNLRSMTAEIVLSVRERMERAQPATGTSFPAHPAAGSDEAALAGGPVTQAMRMPG